MPSILAARKDDADAAFRAWVAADPKRQASYGTALAELDGLIAKANESKLDTLRLDTLNRPQLLRAAQIAYRWAQERAKPDAEREPGYQDRDRLLIEQRLTQIERRFVPSVDRIVFEQALAEYRQVPAEKRNAALEARLAEIGLDRLYAETKLGDTATRLGWLDKPVAEFAASADPFIQLAIAAYPQMIANENKRKARDGDIQRLRPVGDGRAAGLCPVTGADALPDANGSLRFTYGHVKGRARDGMIWTPFTTAEGVVAKQTGKGEFDAPDAAIAKLRARDFGRHADPKLGTLPVNFLSTVDITNGNSGSATLNARGEFVGLAFDGTLDGVVADWSFEAGINRTIHVDGRYMLWVMDKVDGAHRLLGEMGLSPSR